MRLTIDTSVAVKLILPELGSDAARTLLASDAELIAPDLIHVEMTNALWANALSRRISPDLATSLAVAWQPMIGRFYSIADLIEDALRLGLTLNHAIYDCIFLALAIRETAPLITADRRFFDVLADTPFAEHARLLA